MYDQIRLKELEIQMASYKLDRDRLDHSINQAEDDKKRHALEIARKFNSTDVHSLITDAEVIYTFLK